MNENMADRQLADLRGTDLAGLLADDSMKTALDRVLESDAAIYNSFNNFID